MLTVEQVAALAPDAASLKAGQGLASASAWTLLGRDEVLLWGDCRGSGALPYRVTIEHASVDYTCSCPSRKFPCKHVLGLLTLAAKGAVPAGKAPERALEWLVKREVKRRAKAERPEVPEATSGQSDAAREAAAQKRTAAREARVAAGLSELERWLFDVIRLGLATVPQNATAFWNEKAARLVDAQAPGIARRVRALVEVRGPDAAARLLGELGSLYVLRAAYARIDALPAERRADVRRHVGFTQREEDAVARPGALVRDRWIVIGARSEEDERLTSHRAWLFGERTRRYALVLQFTVPGALTTPLAVAVPAGGSFEGALAFFEAVVPQRAVLVERGETMPADTFPPGLDVRAMQEVYARDVAADPWLETIPVVLDAARTARASDVWYAIDATGSALPLTRTGQDPFVLHALCANHPVTLHGEWNGRTLLPLAVRTADRFVRLG